MRANFWNIFEASTNRRLKNILVKYRSTDPCGYSTSVVLARILKIKERISSDRELIEKLAKNPIYRKAIGLMAEHIPSHNTFHTLRKRLGLKGFIELHRHFVLKAQEKGLLIPPLENLPQMVRGKIILIGDSTFLKAVCSTKGQRDDEGNWFFTDPSVAFGKPHHKHKYPVGHRAHTVMTVSGIPLVSIVAPANEPDQLHIIPVLRMVLNRFPDLNFVCVILDSGYDAENLHREIYTELHLLPFIIRKPSMKYGTGFSQNGTPLCPFGYPTRRKGIEYKHQRTKFACYHTCRNDQQLMLFQCPYKNSHSQFGWMTYTYFKDSYRKQGPCVPGARAYKRLKPLRTGIERFYGLVKENRYRMESSNTYMGHDNVLIHVIEHDIVLTQDIIFQHAKTGKLSDVISV